MPNTRDLSLYTQGRHEALRERRPAPVLLTIGQWRQIVGQFGCASLSVMLNGERNDVQASQAPLASFRWSASAGPTSSGALRLRGRREAGRFDWPPALAYPPRAADFWGGLGGLERYK
jgi:hypothetical protein